MKKSKTTNAVGQVLTMPDISEDKLQAQIHIWLWNNYPELRGCFWHVANERKTTAKDGAVLKAKGVVSGVPDYVFNFNGKTYYFELKTSVGQLFDAQKKLHLALEKQGFKVEIIRSLEQFQNIIKQIINATNN